MIIEHIFDKIFKVTSKIYSFFGLFIPFGTDVFKRKEDPLNKWQEVYAVLLSLLILVCYVLVIVHGAIFQFKSTRTSGVLLTVLVTTVMTIITIIAILGNAFWNREYWNQYIKLLKILFEMLNKSVTRYYLYFCLEIILGHVVFLLVVALDIYMYWDNVNSKPVDLVPIFIKNLFFYYIFLLTSITYNTALVIKYQFYLTRVYIANALNIKVDNDSYVFKLSEDNAILPTPVINNKTVDILLNASKIVKILFELVTIFNNLFGHIILCVTLSTVLQTLHCLNELLVLGELDLLDVDIVSSCVLEAIVFLTWNSFIISACSLVKQQCFSIVSLICKLQRMLPPFSQERTELINLSHQIANYNLIISAAGFFEVDLSLIFSIFSCVGTYIVVLIQFSNINF